MTRLPFILSIASVLAMPAAAQTWYDLTVHDAVFDATGTNLVDGAIRPAGVIPTLTEFHAAQSAIAEARDISTNALDIALSASNRAAAAWHDVADLTSNGVWEVAFTLSALRGVGASDDIASQTVGFSVETTPSNRLCHAVQWFSEVPPSMPDFSATHTTNLLRAGFQEIAVANSYPETSGLPSDYGKSGGACYRVTAAVPLEWGAAFFKVTATGFILRGNSLPIVRGVAGGASYDIVAQDAAGMTNVVLNVRGGFIVDTNNPLVLLMMEEL